MNKLLKVVVYVVLALVLVVSVVVGYVSTALPDVGPAEDLKIDYTTERIERGHYLAHAVMLCMDCHAMRDWSKYSGPPIPGTLGAGGDVFDQSVGFPGVFYARNITPAGISRYTDGELYRVITTGVTREGKALFPVMPYLYYGKMDPEDIHSVIAYIRSLEPIQNTIPESYADFPFNIIMNTIPQKAQPQQRPDKADWIAYGAYMTNASGCIECHTDVKGGQIIPELAFAGGRAFSFPDGSVVRSMNITPHKTGIGTWTEEKFVETFTHHQDSSYVIPSVAAGEYNTIMPWMMYSEMEEDDLRAIYAYLQTVKPIENVVERFTPAKQ
ncbi:MAG: c-type cytochrome [Cyclobacteriaceae bacterium]|jgi:cytochrome c2|nr:c-type cytochrome [Cyclobacteriaceae bacterium]